MWKIAIVLVLNACAFDPMLNYMQSPTSCMGPSATNGKCEELHRIGAQLHTPEMEAAIQAARPGEPR